MVGEHRLVPRDAQLQFWVALSYPVQHLHHPRAIVVVRDGREELVEGLDCNVFTLGCKCADQQLIELCLSTRVQTRGRPWFPTGGPNDRSLSR